MVGAPAPRSYAAKHNQRRSSEFQPSLRNHAMSIQLMDSYRMVPQTYVVNPTSRVPIGIGAIPFTARLMKQLKTASFFIHFHSVMVVSRNERKKGQKTGLMVVSSCRTMQGASKLSHGRNEDIAWFRKDVVNPAS